MFHTEPQAELKIPDLFGTQEKTWAWIKFGANLPYFLATVSRRFVEDGEEIGFRETLLLGDERQILALQESQGDDMKLSQVSMLIPDYMRDTVDYTIGILKEIWGCKETGARSYVLSTGEKLSFNFGGDPSSMELLISI